MKKRTILALLLALCLVMGLFAGCSKTEETAPVAETPAAEEAPAAEAEEAPAEPAESEAAPAEEPAPEATTEEQPSAESFGEDGSYTSPCGISYPLEEPVTLSMTQIFNQTFLSCQA